MSDKIDGFRIVSTDTSGDRYELQHHPENGPDEQWVIWDYETNTAVVKVDRREDAVDILDTMRREGWFS